MSYFRFITYFALILFERIEAGTVLRKRQELDYVLKVKLLSCPRIFYFYKHLSEYKYIQINNF